MDGEGKTKVPVTLSLSSDLIRWAKQTAEKEQRSCSNYINKVLREKMLQEQQAEANQR